jgi:hypothetical protein
VVDRPPSLGAIPSQQRIIKPATAFIGKGERPIVWFSTNPVWEQTVHSMETLIRWGVSPCRIAVPPEVAPYRFNKLRRLSGMKADTADALARAARRDGANPDEWRGTFDAVPRDRWLAIEMRNGDSWQEWQEFGNSKPAAARTPPDKA